MDPTTLFARLSFLLTQPLLSIELIPGDGAEWQTQFSSEHAPFLFKDSHLGVPQKPLYRAYIAAVRVLQHPRNRDVLRALRRAPSPGDRDRSSPSPEPRDVAEVIASTSVILLANPAHSAALNARKRLLLRGQLDPGRELALLGALVNVKECAKQAVLWHHRRWILELVSGRAGADANADRARDWDTLTTLAPGAVPSAAWAAELAAAARAGEVYPRNYHAWMHRRLCMRAIASPPAPLLDPGRAATLDRDADALVHTELVFARLWIERHVADHSAVHYLCRLVAHLSALGWAPRPRPDARLHSDASQLSLGSDFDADLLRSLLAHAKALVTTYPAHETLWLYLREASSMARTAASAAQLFPSGESNLDVEGRICTVLDLAPADADRLLAQTGARAHAKRYLLWVAFNDGALVVDRGPGPAGLHQQDAGGQTSVGGNAV